jgi:hypothetical protein
MRYSLRNQSKIQAVTGRLNEILSIFDAYFKNTDSIPWENKGEYRILVLPEITLYILAQKYDVYNLAFKQFNK